MTTESEVIESTALEVVRDEQRQPGNALVSRPDAGPALMISQATALASALRDIVERQKLYAVISGRKFPQVEAWMTIGRMDNVVAREAEIIRHEDGSYEAAAELVRLSDGMVIGRGSALCGTKGDRPWDGRPEPVRRSMAVTRATSRAFRQQYSWIMALAGYEPTPADEMPPEGREDPRDVTPRDDRPAAQHEQGAAEARTTHHDGLIGKAIAQGTQDFQLRQGPDGPVLPFRIKEGRLSQIAVAKGDIAQALDTFREAVIGQRVTVWGHYTDESYRKGDTDITYKVLHVERIQTPDWTLPMPEEGLSVAEALDLKVGEYRDEEPTFAEPEPLFPPLSDEEMEAIGAGLPG